MRRESRARMEALGAKTIFLKISRDKALTRSWHIYVEQQQSVLKEGISAIRFQDEGAATGDEHTYDVIDDSL
jgi:hypothetical protein